ncbi:hypothetical protein IJ531_02040 [bacterium]|nr:hypothetical protein [bacterium]
MEVKEAIEIFDKYGIKTALDNNGLITISHYCQPQGTTFEELGINEDELIEHVVACAGVFDARKSKLTTFPLSASKEIRLYEDNVISEMPELRAAGLFVLNKNIKKLPKLKFVSSIQLEDSPIKSLPKLKQAGILIAQNSELKELPSLETVARLCIVDCPIEDLKNLKYAGDVFICSSDENNKIDIQSLNKLEEVEKLFVANSNIKSIPQLKKAEKIAFYNCAIKSVKQSIGASVEIANKITDEELSEKFDTFTDWYNSEVLQKSMDILGDIVNKINS